MTFLVTNKAGSVVKLRVLILCLYSSQNAVKRATSLTRDTRDVRDDKDGKGGARDDDCRLERTIDQGTIYTHTLGIW